jgi:hypothetical protein
LVEAIVIDDVIDAQSPKELACLLFSHNVSSSCLMQQLFCGLGLTELVNKRDWQKFSSTDKR